jgi:hypothetical protein
MALIDFASFMNGKSGLHEKAVHVAKKKLQDVFRMWGATGVRRVLITLVKVV